MLEFVLLWVPLVVGLQFGLNLATFQAAQQEGLQLATSLAQNLAAADSTEAVDLPTLDQLQSYAIFARITSVAARQLDDRLRVCVDYGSGVFAGKAYWSSVLEPRI